jgi:hypothetical protein
MIIKYINVLDIQNNVNNNFNYTNNLNDLNNTNLWTMIFDAELNNNSNNGNEITGFTRTINSDLGYLNLNQNNEIILKKKFIEPDHVGR